MIRIAWLWILAVGAASAQTTAPPPSAQSVSQAQSLATLRQRADKASAEWSSLASTLEARIVRLLPCDPKGRAAIEEVSRASEGRFAALSDYLRTANENAKNDTEAAKQVLASLASIAGAWNTERAEAVQERTALEAMAASLAESALVEPGLAPAQQTLAELERMVKQRIAKAEDQAAVKDKFYTLLGNVVIAYQDRQTAIANETAAVEEESTRWNAYYAARLARSQIECSITGLSANTSTAVRKKR